MVIDGQRTVVDLYAYQADLLNRYPALTHVRGGAWAPHFLPADKVMVEAYDYARCRITILLRLERLRFLLGEDRYGELVSMRTDYLRHVLVELSGITLTV